MIEVEYVKELLQILDKENIDCGYMTLEEVVHGFYNDGETEVRCFFLCGFPHKLMSYSICNKPIPTKNVEEVEANLSKINKELQTGYFYFDEDSQCIAYYHDFEPQPTHSAATKSEVLEKFCRWSYEAFLHHYKSLYSENVNI